MWGWSPEQIAGRLRKHNHGQTIICPETIYRYIYSSQGRKENLREYLVRAHKKRHPKHSRKSYRRGIANRVSIDLRPREISTKKTFGHWEADVVEGKGHSGGIQTLLWKEKLDSTKQGLSKRLTQSLASELKNICCLNYPPRPDLL